MCLIQQSPQVFLMQSDIVVIGAREIDILKKSVINSVNGRVRINTHQSNMDLLHEMFIAIRKNSYIRVHKHPEKSEAFHIIYGSVRIVVFNDNGSIHRVIELSANDATKSFYYRLSKPYFHTLLIDSELAVIHEITNGPFIEGNTIFASFSPEESNLHECQIFYEGLIKKIKQQERACDSA